MILKAIQAELEIWVFLFYNNNICSQGRLWICRRLDDGEWLLTRSNSDQSATKETRSNVGIISRFCQLSFGVFVKKPEQEPVGATAKMLQHQRDNRR